MHQIDQFSSVNQTEVQQDLEDLLVETRGSLKGLHHDVLTDVDGSQLIGMIESQMKEGGNWKSYSSMKKVQTSDTLAQMVLDYLDLWTTKIDALEWAMSFAGYKELQQQYVDTFGPTIQINWVEENVTVDGYKGPQFWKAASMLVSNTVYGPTAADALPPEAPIAEQQQNLTLDESIQDVASVKGDLEANWFLLKSSGKWFEEDGTSRESNRTSLVWLKQSTVTGMKSMMARLNIHHPWSKLIITWWTEGWIHSNNGEHTHRNGYKIDLSTRWIKWNAARELIALTQVTQWWGRKYWKIPWGDPFGDQEQRIWVDREPSYVDKNWKEQKDHLDIVFYPPGYVLPRDKKWNPIEEEGYAVLDDDVEKAGEDLSENNEVMGIACPFDERFTVEQVKTGIAQEFSRTEKNKGVKVPLTVDDVYNACLKHSIPAPYFLAISRNDSHHATTWKWARTKNPWNYWNTDSGAERSFASYSDWCMALAKHLRKVIDTYNKKYWTTWIPELKQLVTWVWEDGEKFWWVWMSDVSWQNRVTWIQRTIEWRISNIV